MSFQVGCERTLAVQGSVFTRSRLAGFRVPQNLRFTAGPTILKHWEGIILDALAAYLVT